MTADESFINDVNKIKDIVPQCVADTVKECGVNSLQDFYKGYKVSNEGDGYAVNMKGTR